MKKKYVVNLNDTQRQVLRDCVEKGRSSAYKIRHAHILLKADAKGPCWTDAQSFVEKCFSDALGLLSVDNPLVVANLMDLRRHV